MSGIDTTFIAALRAEIASHRQKNIELVLGGGLDEKAYGYSCGYIKCLDDLVRSERDDLCIIDQVLADIQKR